MFMWSLQLLYLAQQSLSSQLLFCCTEWWNSACVWFNTDNAMEMTKTSLPTKKINPIAWNFFMTVLKDQEQRTHLTLSTDMRKLPLDNPSNLNQSQKSIQLPMNRGKQTMTTYHLYSIHENWYPFYVQQTRISSK